MAMGARTQISQRRACRLVGLSRTVLKASPPAEDSKANAIAVTTITFRRPGTIFLAKNFSKGFGAETGPRRSAVRGSS